MVIQLNNVSGYLIVGVGECSCKQCASDRLHTVLEMIHPIHCFNC